MVIGEIIIYKLLFPIFTWLSISLMLILFLFIQPHIFVYFTLCRTFLSQLLNFFFSKFCSLCISLMLILFLFIQPHIFVYFTLCRTFLSLILFFFIQPRSLSLSLSLS